MENHSQTNPNRENYSKTNHRQEKQIHLLLNYLKLNPGLAISISYLLLTLCGLFYSAAYYQEFNINILQFVEISVLLNIGINDSKVFCFVTLFAELRVDEIKVGMVRWVA